MNLQFLKIAIKLQISYDIVGHSGEENDLPFTRLNQAPANEKER